MLQARKMTLESKQAPEEVKSREISVSFFLQFASESPIEIWKMGCPGCLPARGHCLDVLYLRPSF